MANINDEEFIRRLAEAAENLRKELDPLAKLEKEQAELAEKNAKALKEFSKGLAGASVQFSKAAIEVSDGAGKYANSVEGAGLVINKFASNFGTAGKVIGGVIEAFAKLTGGVFRQNEALLKTYRSLSDVGSLGKSFDEIKENIHQAGYSIDQNADSYAKAIQKAAPGLALFAGNVAEGSKKLHDVMVLELGKAEYELQRFGYTQEELFEKTGTFMGILGASGGMRKKQDTELFAITKEYLIQLAALSQLTGQQKEETERKMIKDANDLRYQMFLRRLEESGEAGKEMALNIRTGIASMPEELAEGAKSMMVNQGKIVDEYGAQFVQGLGYKGYDVMMNTFKSSAEEFPNAFADMMFQQGGIMNKRFDQFGNQIALGNDTMKDFMLTMGMWKYTLQGTALDEKARNELAERLAKIRADQTKTDINMNTEREKGNRKIRNAFEEFEYQMSKFLIPLLNTFGESLQALGESMAEFAYTFSFHKIDVRDAFRSLNNLNDVSQALAAQEEKRAQLEKEEKKIKEDLKSAEEDLLRVTKSYANTKMSEEEKEKATRGARERVESLKGDLSGIERKRESSNRLSKRAITAGQQMASERNETFGETPVGGPESKIDLATITSKSGKTAQVAKQYQGAFQQLIDYLDAQGYQIKSLGGYNDRNVAGTNKKSYHAYGAAIDINPGDNPMGSELITDMPEGIGKVAAGFGLGWGGNWSNKKDAMHFSASVNEGGSLLQAKNGGIFRGPVKGYNVRLHGDEVVTPLRKGISKQPLSSHYSSFSDGKEMKDVFLALIDKMTTLVDLARTANNTHEEHLQHAKQA